MIRSILETCFCYFSATLMIQSVIVNNCTVVECNQFWIIPIRFSTDCTKPRQSYQNKCSQRHIMIQPVYNIAGTTIYPFVVLLQHF